MAWYWLTTAPGDSSKTHSADQGQRGWKLHLVYVPDFNNPARKLRGLRAVCGLRPYKGWGLDMFIEDRCSRCDAWVDKRPGMAEKLFPLAPRDNHNRGVLMDSKHRVRPSS